MIRTFIDGTEVTDTCLDGTSKHTLGKPFEATVTLPIDYADDDLVGMLLRVEGDNGEFPLSDDDIDHHGRILNVSDNDDENSGTTVVTSYGPDEIWKWRPARDGAAGEIGNYSKPTFITRLTEGPEMMEEILTQSADGSDQALGEGDMLIELGGFDTGGADLSGAPTNWPMTIAQIRSLLQDTGEVDVIVTPINTGGNIGRVDVFNGDYGNDLTASVEFEYATGLNNVRLIRRTQDMATMCNKLRYLLGPKFDDQHWRRSIEGTNTDIPDPPLTNILALRSNSQTDFGVRFDLHIYDSFGTEADSVPLYWRLWLTEQLLRSQPRTLVHVTPVRGWLPVEFDIGDIIGVGAGSAFRGGFATAGQRVYDRTVSWDREGICSIAEIQTSADQEAAD